jgi:UDP-3-O-[3-hydroxymyristoyl] N-acetylglucosamine deacetylase
LHTGARAKLEIQPAAADHGIVFVRTDLPGRPELPARSEFVVDTSMATTLGVGGARLSTVEHLMSALAGLGIDNARVLVGGPEVPIMDGSAAPFAELLREAGIRKQDRPKSFLVIRRAVTVADGDKRATLAPSRRFRVDCSIDFKHPLIHDQSFGVEFTDVSFAREVARARTFGFLRDVERLQSMGLARGGSLQNAIVVDDFNILNPEGLRFPDEFVRHKTLDALGDIALLGLPVLGHLTVVKSGHALHLKLVKKVLSDCANYEVVRARGAELERFDLVETDLEGVLAPSLA